MFALTTAAKFVESGTHKKVIVVGADKMSSIVDYTDRTTCVIFGDGAGAVLLEPSEDGNGIQDSILKSNGEGRHYLHQKSGGSLNPASEKSLDEKMHYIYQNGRPVFKAAVSSMSSVAMELIEKHNLTKEDIKWLVPHQQILESLRL